MPEQHHAMTAAVSLSRNEKTEQRIVEKLLQDADPRFRPASDGGARFSPAGAVQVTWASVDYLGLELETKVHEVFTRRRSPWLKAPTHLVLSHFRH